MTVRERAIRALKNGGVLSISPHTVRYRTKNGKTWYKLARYLGPVLKEELNLVYSGTSQVWPHPKQYRMEKEDASRN